MTRVGGLFVVALATSACASPASTALARKNIDELQALQRRVAENRPQLVGAVADLQRVSDDALKVQFSLSTSIAKAKLLDSMNATFAKPSPTQREVVLYSLYALSEAQQQALEVRLAQRRAEIAETLAAYDRLTTLAAEAVRNERTVLAYFDRPTEARVGEAVGVLLGETKKFREGLAASDDPRAKALAEKVDAAEKKVESATKNAQSVVEEIEKLR